MAWVLPLAFLILMILGLLLARERRSTAYRTMIAIAVAAVVVFIALRITRSIIAGLIAEPASEQVYNAIVDQIGQRLLAQTMWLALLAAVALEAQAEARRDALHLFFEFLLFRI